MCRTSVAAPPTWDDLFDRAQLMAFVAWHAARMGRHLTTQGGRS